MKTVASSSDYYETNAELSRYLLLHYGEVEELLPIFVRGNTGLHADFLAEYLHFPRRVVELFETERLARKKLRALDIGCSVGASTFALAEFANEVVGVDYSAQFINTAKRLLAGEGISIRVNVEGEISVLRRDVEIRAKGAHKVAGKIRFERGDACALPAELGKFDLLLAANLLCRLPKPKSFLQDLPNFSNPGAQVLFTTPCTWLAEFTELENMPKQSTFDFIKENIAAEFKLLKSGDIPLVIREHERKWQLIFSQYSLWQAR